MKKVQCEERKHDAVNIFKHKENNNQTGKKIFYFIKRTDSRGSRILKVRLQQKGNEKFSGSNISSICQKWKVYGRLHFEEP